MATSVAVLFLAVAPVAYATAPANDDFAHATIVAPADLSFTDSIADVSEATVEPTDPTCVGQEENSVWYSFTPDADMRVEANTFGSNYDTVLGLVTGTPGSFEILACSDDAGGGVQSRIRFDVTNGVTYYFKIGTFPGAPPGSLTFNLLEAPPVGPPPEATLTIDPVGAVDPRTGVVTLQGTVTCTTPVSGFVDIHLQQRAGRALISGSGGNFVVCEDSTRWVVEVVGDNGRFVGGRAQADGFSQVCDPDDQCAEAAAFRTVRLKGGK